MSEPEIETVEGVFEVEGGQLRLSAEHGDGWCNLMVGQLGLYIDNIVCVDAADDKFANVEIRTHGKLLRALAVKKEVYEELVTWLNEQVPDYMERYDSYADCHRELESKYDWS